MHRFRVPEATDRLDRLVTAALPHLTRSRAKGLIDGGRVTVDGAVLRASARPPPGSEVLVDEPVSEPTQLVPEALPLEILHQDAHLAVVVKPAGLVVHPAPGHWTGTLVHALLHHLEGLSNIGGQDRPGIVHRLDKGTSGVMVVARDDATHRGLGSLFAAHDLDRRYLALVRGRPDLDAGTIRTEHGRHPRDRLRFASVPGGRRAVTRWRVRRRFAGAALLECQLETGRTHQVRVHLDDQGWPIAGDPLYGRGRTPSEPLRSLAAGLDHQLLHAYRLAFRHPVTGEELAFEAPLPEDFAAVIRGLESA